MQYLDDTDSIVTGCYCSNGYTISQYGVIITVCDFKKPP